MSDTVKPIPEGFHSLTPHIIVAGAADAIAFYEEAFGAEELSRSYMPDGKTIIHAAIRIGDSNLMLADEMPQFGALGPKAHGGTAVTMNFHVEDADAAFERAVAAGATVIMPLADQFWGDRYGRLQDPFGHSWAISQHVRDVSPEEIEKATAEFASQGAG